MDIRASLIGQSLSEYILAGALVAMVGLSALVTLGNTVSVALPDLLDRIFGKPSPMSSVEASSGNGASVSGSSSLPGAEVAATSTGSGHHAVKTYQSVSITLSSGQTITLDNFPVDVKSIVDTSGANGVTRIYAAQIQSLAQALKTNGTISADQASVLEKLANQGHRIARAENAIEEAATRFTDSDTFKAGTVEFDGQTVGIKDLADSVSHGDLVNDFMTLYTEAKSSGALDEDDVKRVVRAMYQDIKTIADIFETNVDMVASGSASPDELNRLNASQITHTDSANICHAGNGKDSGVQCN